MTENNPTNDANPSWVDDWDRPLDENSLRDALLMLGAAIDKNREAREKAG